MMMIVIIIMFVWKNEVERDERGHYFEYSVPEHL